LCHLFLCFASLFAQASAAQKRVKIGLERAYMNWVSLGVHQGVMAGSHACEPVHGMPFAACGGWIEDVGPLTHQQAPLLLGHICGNCLLFFCFPNPGFYQYAHDNLRLGIST